jgi:hypothetical protein
MRFAIVTLLIASACAPEDPVDLASWDDAGLDEALPGAALPPPSFTIAVSHILTGVADVSAAPLPSGTVVQWAFSVDGAGAGPCFPLLGGECIDILNPARLATSVADANGLAVASLVLPTSRYGIPTWIQGVVYRPGRPAVLSPVTNRITGGFSCPLVFRPVCGYDGVTYGSACDAEAVGMVVAYTGLC